MQLLRAAGWLIWLASAGLTLPGGDIHAETLEVGGARIEYAFSDSPPEKLRPLVHQWLHDAARAVTVYHGRFPISRAKIRIQLKDGHGPSSGTAYGWSGPLITISVGRESTAADFADDWLMTHEMLHFGFPSVPEQHSWIEEGLSTYAEPIARARAGQISVEKAWRSLVNGLPQGLPKADDRGLDHTPTWGRTYWGGALFCLLADLEIRKRTKNEVGLEHAVRGIVAAGGTIRKEWTMDRVIEMGDRATGVPVLRELYDQMKAAPYPVDLDALWKELGIERKGHRIIFNESAPRAHLRRAITAPANKPAAGPLPR